MRRINLLFLSMMALCLMFAVAVAQEGEMSGEQEMPPMGPPDEMKELAHLEGTWDVAMSSKWDPTDTVWIDETATAVFRYACNGAAMMEEFTSQMMGMPFTGMMLQCFDRETGMWQTVWTDDTGARISYYTGKTIDGKTVVEGEDIYQGQSMITRITTFDETDTSFKWMMETSMDDGKTFFKVSEATYTKRK
ncbi:MAG: DUF1579 domain-containing protein [candidate division Zixibacteria bacterium]|nr:DUF1579 domain-containing protein [candidate division Zixibacteria bacterium]